MKKREKVWEKLYLAGKELEIPESLSPESMRESLAEYEKKRYFRRGRLYPAVALAACLALAAGIALKMAGAGLVQPAAEEQKSSMAALPGDLLAAGQGRSRTKERELLGSPKLSYEEIYAQLSESWDSFYNGSKEAGMGVYETEAKMEAASDASADRQQASSNLLNDMAFGRTNVQVETVAEGDCIQNDGRYLYQIVRRQAVKEGGAEETAGSGTWETGIQILDTKDGLREAAFVDDFENVEEFYVWEDLLVAIESKYLDAPNIEPLTSEGKMVIDDLAYAPQGYYEISIYDIKDREKPKRLKTFTLEGAYESSRISGGYFYGIGSFWTSPGEGDQDYGAYIPTLDGKRLETEQIYCPAGQEGDGFLVLTSIDLKNPYQFVDARAVLADSGTYYVSEKNIYLTSYESVYQNPQQQEGKVKDRTRVLKFSYLEGHFYGQARGEIPGRLDSSFSMDEYEGNLRVAATVEECQAKKVVDDRTGEELGYDYGERKESNALYILGRNLAIKGKIEGLAEGESIYSARFLGEVGYFVTFRQTDPLFAVDLSDPEHPEVLGELKVSGFSEYLHGYGEGCLFGIGMEADEETGRQQGMKLSMFDVADPKDVKEESRLRLENYNYSEALYNHRAVLIDVSENIIGFCAEGSDYGKYWKRYLVFTYENGAFVKQMELDMGAEGENYERLRATFIGDVLYLLNENGSVRAYSRSSKGLLFKL